MKIRVGHGYDVHRLVKNRPLILGGVKIEHSTGLDGHSDADVLVHAIIDALLGAAALGDIGKLFPDNDNNYLNISSLFLLNETVKLIFELGYEIENIDSTIVAEMPKLSPFIGEMRKNIANVLKLDEADINIKATTEEKLGFTGALEGIAAHAVCIIKRDL